MKPAINNKNFKLRDFVEPDEPELEYFRQTCNFSENELMYFNLRARDKSNVQISLEMNISEPQVSKLARRVKDKMKRVL